MELLGEMVGFWLYFEGRAKRICQLIRCGVSERERDMEKLSMTRKVFGPRNGEWSYHILIWVGKTGGKVSLGGISGVQFWNV